MQHLGCRLALLHVGHHRSLGHERSKDGSVEVLTPPFSPPKTKMTGPESYTRFFVGATSTHSNGLGFPACHVSFLGCTPKSPKVFLVPKMKVRNLILGYFESGFSLPF